MGTGPLRDSIEVESKRMRRDILIPVGYTSEVAEFRRVALEFAFSGDGPRKKSKRLGTDGELPMLLGKAMNYRPEGRPWNVPPRSTKKAPRGSRFIFF